MFGLEPHPDKTRRIVVGRYAERDGNEEEKGKRDVRLSMFSALVWMTSCARDEGSPLGIGFQEQIPEKHTDMEFTMN
jgi:hypothetical protein